MNKKNHQEKKPKEQDIDLTETADEAEISEETQDAEETKAAETEHIDSNDDQSAKIEALEKELQNEKDKYMRLFAEFDNFRKRTSKEKTEAYGDATAKTIYELLPVIDNFDRALDTPCSDENFKKGIDMIFTQMKDIFAKIGVTEIDALQKPFDPNLHNAIKQAESDELEADTVCEVFQKGYKLGDRIIRHSMVSVTI